MSSRSICSLLGANGTPNDGAGIGAVFVEGQKGRFGQTHSHYEAPANSVMSTASGHDGWACLSGSNLHIQSDDQDSSKAHLPDGEQFVIVIRHPALQCFHIDDKTIPHIAFERPFKGLVYLLHRNHLDIRGNVVVRTVIEHILSLVNAADARAGQFSSFE